MIRVDMSEDFKRTKCLVTQVRKIREKPRFSINYDILDSMGIFDCSDNMLDNHSNER